jgi:serine/threonine-protein kinase
VSTGAGRPLASVRPDVDPALVAIVERAMAFDPDDRYSSAAAMAAALQPATVDAEAGGDETAALTGAVGLGAGATQVLSVPVAAPDAAIVTELRPERPRLPLAWLAVAAALVVLGILLMLNRSSGSGSSAGPTATTAPVTAPPVSLSPELDAALDELDSAVHP